MNTPAFIGKVNLQVNAELRQRYAALVKPSDVDIRPRRAERSVGRVA